MRRLVHLLLAISVVALAAPVVVQAADGTIRGTVTPTSIAQEVEVCVAEPRPPEPCTTPTSDGSYSLTGLQARPLKIEFIPPYHSRYMVEYWNHVYTPAEATPVPLSSDMPIVDGVDADLQPGGVIEGTVTGTGGPSLPGVEVCAFDSQGAFAACSQTNSEGEYELHSLSPGSYRVRFFARGPSAEYVSEYYVDGKTLAAATPIALAASAVRGGVDAELAKGGQVRGTVRAAADGTSLGSIPVCLFVGNVAAAEQCVISDSGGAYSFVGLPTGDYQVGFALSGDAIDGEAGGVGEADGYLSQYYEGVSNRSAARNLPLVGSQILGGIDAALSVSPTPSPPPPLAAVAEPPIAAAPSVSEPNATVTKKCKHGYIRKKVRGHHRCIKGKRVGKRHRSRHQKNQVKR